MTVKTMPTPNVELLDQVLEAIEKEDGKSCSRWEQGMWRGYAFNEKKGEPTCKSAMCFAGWTVELSGGKWLVPVKDIATSMYEDAVIATKDEVDAGISWTPDGYRREIVAARTRAERVLGLTPFEAGSLFAPSNSLDDIRTIIAEIKERAK